MRFLKRKGNDNFFLQIVGKGGLGGPGGPGCTGGHGGPGDLYGLVRLVERGD